MKKWIALFLSAMLLMSASLALATATNPETGENVTYADGVMKVYDRIVFEVVSPTGTFRDVSVAAKPAPAAAMKAVVADLEALLNKDIAAFAVEGEEKLVNNENLTKIASLKEADKVEAILLALGLVDEADVSDAVKAAGIVPQDFFNAESGEFADGVDVQAFTVENIEKGGTESGFGFLTLGDDQVPFLRIAIEVIHADSGDYAGLSLAERTYIENYNFTFQDGEWGLYSIVQGLKSMF